MSIIKKADQTIFFKNRIKKFRQRLNESAIDTGLIYKTENIYYLIGFFAKDSGSILIVSENKLYLLVHFLFIEQAKKTNMPVDVELIQFKSTSESYKKLSSIISGIAGKTIALEGSSISFNDYIRFSDLLKKQDKKVKNLPGFIEELRTVKDEYELSLIKKSCRINERSVKYVFGKSLMDIKDLTEIELSLQIEQKMIEFGARGKSFDLIVAGKRSSSYPHYESSHRRINEGLLLLDLGCKYMYYCSDITRSIFLGSNKEKDKFRRIYDIVLQAQIKAIDHCKDGAATDEIDRVAREHIAARGYGDNFGHGLGHGVGLEVHEAPIVYVTEKKVLKENMVITVEPGIYLEGLGGIRIEDMVIIKKNRCENLYSVTKKLSVID
jgi:Xaa-Pro aminopeptidase